MKTQIQLILLFAFLSTSLGAQMPLFPTPAKTMQGKGSFVVGNNLSIEAQGDAQKIADQFSQNLKEMHLSDAASSGTVHFKLNKEKAMAPEAYSLQITSSAIQAEASSISGLFYAKEALLQLIRFNKGSLNACRIEDQPRYGWRGFMLDESRHFFGKEKVKQYLDIMASLRMNIFHWHLTDEPGWRIEIKRYPKLTTVGGIGNWHDPKAPATYYTQEDIKEIVAYAAERQITVIPEFDMPGHATAVCRAYPEVSGGGEGRWQHFTFHPCKEETYEFISHVLDEIITLFPSPYIHIGGDEVHYGNQSWFTDPEIQQFIQEKKLVNEVGLEHYFIRRIADMVASKGKTIIGWDEIVDAGVSPSKAVVMWWRHDRQYQLVKALEQGFRVIMTPRRPLYGDFVQYGGHAVGRLWNGYNPIEDIYRFPDNVIHLMKNYEDQIMGMQMSMWTERIADPKRLDFMVFPRLVAVAESAWTLPKAKESSLFMKKLPRFLEFLDTKGIYYFNPFAPDMRPEPTSPEKEDLLQNG
ncbi:beta-hexosaminidase [Parabacteroides sp. 52]|uniref:beta-N-acetylhexosaminidase n=1 Tax=unclassified Parabacteroides TaxID=2649774 RepID=UPI0013D4D9C7|nr:MULTISPECIES: beta-N-acetylhexosaminidase [unclassified Parabacteroides]MDH6535419.1 hexosaminidase [Parabacteroides sp. PM5-20]NDV56063.1 beta-hexosaminidase [Parabacteroides sp. 52]